MKTTNPPDWYNFPADNSYYFSTPSFSPEYWRLTIVDTIERGGGYDYDTTILWKHENGTFWIGHDSGCSCPTPFDGYDFGDGLQQVHRASDITDFLASFDSWQQPTVGEGIDMARKGIAAGLPW